MRGHGYDGRPVKDARLPPIRAVRRACPARVPGGRVPRAPAAHRPGPSPRPGGRHSSHHRPVTDETGVLEGRTGEIEAAVEDLLDEHGVQLFVVYVPTTDERNAPDFAAETAPTNSLGADDALLLVAIDDRTDAIWVADGLDEISDDEIDTILADTLEPRLRDGDFAGAAIETAQALGVAAESAAPTSVPAPTAPGPTTAPGGGSTDEGGGAGGLIGLLLWVPVSSSWARSAFARLRPGAGKPRSGTAGPASWHVRRTRCSSGPMSGSGRRARRSTTSRLRTARPRPSGCGRRSRRPSNRFGPPSRSASSSMTPSPRTRRPARRCSHRSSS